MRECMKNLILLISAHYIFNTYLRVKVSEEESTVSAARVTCVYDVCYFVSCCAMWLSEA